jgi:hypothetical protein
MAEKEEIREQSENSVAMGMPDVSATIDKLLANPELINMVASAIGKSSPVTDEKEQNAVLVSSKTGSVPDVISSIAPVLSALKGADGHNSRSDHRSCLLAALKPYLCKERCEAIDYMIKLGKISELLKNMS